MKYDHHLYTYRNQFGSQKHSWSLVGQEGGLDFHVSIAEDKLYGVTAGLEIHRFKGSGAPNHLDCWLLKSPCWHDGTSSYAMDTLWPMIEPFLKIGNHDTIFKLLEGEATKQELNGKVDNDD